jgi:hypothetical protein
MRLHVIIPPLACERDAILRNNARNGTEIGVRVLARLKNVGCARERASNAPFLGMSQSHVLVGSSRDCAPAARTGEMEMGHL